MAECAFGSCDRPVKAHGLCAAHRAQQLRGRPLTEIRPLVRSVEAAECDVEDFEFLLASGESVERAVQRMGLSARTIARRYERIGRPVPRELWAFEARYYYRKRKAS
ncbi:HNH endonuclease [Mycobacterium phage Charlie]|uniref:Helix-turn-helix DNA binding protein n=1 Tax=Mycobacterium phage Charlie TaxID=1056830 RepID=G1FTZ2_9CAUD|nr:HNH endonuclease [Mycobacterium phage Charlie]AEL19976.1 helix-turn-helix DNA binding protein [Mycobacterium phage Charlie]